MKTLTIILSIFICCTLPSNAQSRAETTQSMSRLGKAFLKKKEPSNEQNANPSRPEITLPQSDSIPVVRKASKSDVDIEIPTTNFINDKTFAVIIANENYQKESNVEYALNDGRIMHEYFIKTLGIPLSNVHRVENATLNNIKYELSWLKKVSQAYCKDSISVIFYYAGHGIPDEASKSAYLLPIDGYGTDPETGLRLGDVYALLGSLQTKKTLLILDACFSGASRGDQMLASARGVAIQPRDDMPTGNLIVFSASSDNQTAYPYKEKEHGLFTYFILKHLQSTQGNGSLFEMADYVRDNVAKISVVANQKSQSPSLTPSLTMLDKWASLKLYTTP